MENKKLLYLFVQYFATPGAQRKSLLGMLKSGYYNEVFAVQRWVEKTISQQK